MYLGELRIAPAGTRSLLAIVITVFILPTVFLGVCCGGSKLCVWELLCFKTHSSGVAT